ncbi:MAG: biotin--[acetyl-CoA-carboxylase] ligase [Cyclobacteriaceae bacterium]|nr:biotin--[acetyl-CoA-carboxylase] ligase [Cyclobacteriaceae bacterium]
MYKIPANTLFIGQNLIYVPECHSTNSLLSELNDSSQLPEGSVVITDSQTAGRGQRGNTWEAEPGMNITFSLLLRPVFLQAKDQFQLNMAISLAIVDALRKFVSNGIKLKWPNDIYINDFKIGGILIENQLKGSALSSSIVGIGLNINQQQFSSPIASSLYHFTGIAHDLNHVFQDIVAFLEAEYLDLRAGKSMILKERYINALYRFNENHHYESEGENFQGLISDIDEQGRLCIETQGRSRVFSFKEVKFL